MVIINKKLILGICIFLLVLTPIVYAQEEKETSWWDSMINWFMELLGISHEEAQLKANEIYGESYSIIPVDATHLNFTFYSGVKYIYEDEQWKDREDARSFKGSSIICNVESDKENLVECLDYNETSRILKLSTAKDLNVQLRKYEVNITKNLTSKTIDKIYDNSLNEIISFSKTGESKETMVLADSNDIIEFGEYSTNVTLNVDTGIEDGCVNEEGGGWDGTGPAVTMPGSWTGDYFKWSYFSLNNTPILNTTGITSIDNAILYVYIYTHTGTNNPEITFHNVYEQNFSQTAPYSWSAHPCVGVDDFTLSPVCNQSAMLNITQDTDGADATWENYTLTPAFEYGLANNYENVTVFAKSWNELVYGYQNIRSSEYADNYYRPYVEVMVTVLLNNAPTTPDLNAPVDNIIIEDDILTIEMNWSNSTDVEDDTLTYYLEIYNESEMTNIMYSNSSISETINTTSDLVTFPNETNDYFWHVLAYDGTENSSWSSLWNVTINVTFTPNRAPINIEIIPPSPDNGTITINTTHTYNCTADDFDNDTLYYELYLDTNNPPVTLIANETAGGSTNTSDDGENWWMCRAVDGKGGVSSYSEIRFLNIDNSTIKNYTTPIYSASTTEGAIDRIEINISYNPLQLDYVDANLIYQNVQYALTQINLSETLARFYTDLTIPIVTDDPTSAEFYFNITDGYNNGSIAYETTNNYTQTVGKIGFFSNCTENATQALSMNFTFWSENTFEKLENMTNDTIGQTDFDATFTLWSSSSTKNINTTTTFSVDNESEIDFCISPPEASFLGDGTIQYSSATYDYRYYFFKDAIFDNQTQNISLYLLEISLGSLINIQVKDSTGAAVEDAYIYVERYDVGTNTYRLVAMGRTDSDGNSYIYLRKFDVWYKFKVVYNGETVYIDAQSRLIGTDTITLKTEESTLVDDINRKNSIEWNVYNTTDSLVLTYTDVSGKASKNCFVVSNRNTTYEEYLCTECQEQASGTIICNIGDRNGTFVWSYYSSASSAFLVGSGIWENIVKVLLDALRNSGIGIFASFFIVLTLGLVGAAIGKVSTVVLYTLFGLLVTMVLGFSAITWYVYSGLVVGGIVYIILAKS